MKAMALRGPGVPRLDSVDLPTPHVGVNEVLVRVRACGVCRTDLHIVDGELPSTAFPIVPGHEIVGVVEAIGRAVDAVRVGDRVGIPWLGSTCGQCGFCRSGRENLCGDAKFTGYHIHGGYAEYTVARAPFVVRIPSVYDDVEAAPLLCAGLIGYRSYRMAGDARRLGLYGFGAAAHIIAQVAAHEGREVLAFTSPGHSAAQRFARSLGAVWAGASTDEPPMALDAAIIFAPVGALVPMALAHVVPGGTVVCAGIHMSDIPAFPYRLLWQERVVRSVANLTRQDAHDLLVVAGRVPIRTHVTPIPLAEANRALSALRAGQIEGAAVLIP
ncbi:MAG: alcohol dehydrogenase [Acidobacteria bacterium]|nr:MAG: alcohol dehydrogenase [Acidobacteriota bacterium]